jgi:hypothetical protein
MGKLYHAGESYYQSRKTADTHAISSIWATGVTFSIMCTKDITMLGDLVNGRGRD